ncbi:MAG: hypothetical protein O7H41_03155 [Planctomycetota bacterium]|nr:hypothetical protein [Planctomycetota bacterium]
MHRWLPLLLIIGLPITALSGCTAKPVEYARSGEPHCPNPTCKARLATRVVRCTRCDTRLRWVGAVQTCWHCDGVKLCPICDGSGRDPGKDSTEKCYFCVGEGECPQCDDYGMIEFGGVEPYGPQ